MALEAIRYRRGHLEILDQLKLPHVSEYIEIRSVEDAWNAIKLMQVRGAPAIAIVGCLSLVVELQNMDDFGSYENLFEFIEKKLDYLVSSRPTAINMRKSRHAMLHALQSQKTESVSVAKERMIDVAESMLSKDLSDNKAVGDHGAQEVLSFYNGRSVSILTHCNTGSLATTGYGTALGVIRSLHGQGKLTHSFCTETRPYNQGSRLTAYELVYEKIPATLICDSMAAALMKAGKVDAVVTGADQVALNGDTANKIGTYSLAVLANFHKIPFYIALPTTSFNPDRTSGDSIVIEERPAAEMTHTGGVHVAAEGIHCWNPAFDVTPASLITGIITEYGVFKPHELASAFASGWHKTIST